MTLAALLSECRRRLREGEVATPDLDARLLLAEAFGTDAAGLVLRAGEPVPAETAALAEAHIARRLAGEPVHRILGRRAFYLNDFALSPHTLEPRPDTEILVDLCRRPIEAVLAAKGTCRLADVGTGTGAIAISLLHLFPALDALAIDLAFEALLTARANAEAAGVGPRFHPLCSDYLSAVRGPLDVVVSNPPYIPTDEIAGLSREVRDFDPRLALDGGADGLDAYRILAAETVGLLGPFGHVLVEIGHGQERDVTTIFLDAGLVVAASAEDLGGTKRALWFMRTA